MNTKLQFSFLHNQQNLKLTNLIYQIILSILPFNFIFYFLSSFFKFYLLFLFKLLQFHNIFFIPSQQTKQISLRCPSLFVKWISNWILSYWNFSLRSSYLMLLTFFYPLHFSLFLQICYEG